MQQSFQPLDLIPTRAAGLARLQAFLPHAGRSYAEKRNTDFAPSAIQGVSGLSPYIRRRLISESEVILAVLQHHSPAAAEKFIQEVVWRSYWKGWLEMRPALLSRFDRERRELKQTVSEDSDLRARFERSIFAQSGIDCFDAWVAELRQTGWLHNHTRMWFASIWVFTLRLPWQLGADFFYKHLLDADPASNTLSWRWVAGLHTPGKHYLARAENIRTFTQGRFNPVGQLAEQAEPIPLDASEPVAGIPSLRSVGNAALKRALLVTDEDLHPESLPQLAGLNIAAIAVLQSPMVGEPDGPAARFSRGARADALQRASQHFKIEADLVQPEDLPQWARSKQVEGLVTAYLPTGMLAWLMADLELELAASGIDLTRVRREWDERAWPHATAGFFKLKAQIPNLIESQQ